MMPTLAGLFSLWLLLFSGLRLEGVLCKDGVTSGVQKDANVRTADSANPQRGVNKSFIGNFEDITSDEATARPHKPSFIGPSVEVIGTGEDDSTISRSTTTTTTTTTKTTNTTQTSTTTKAPTKSSPNLYVEALRAKGPFSSFEPWEADNYFDLLDPFVNLSTTTTTTSTTTTTTTTTTTPGVPVDRSYPTEIVEVGKPFQEELERCRSTLPISAVSHGETEFLLRGGWNVQVGEGGKTLDYNAVSDDLRPPPRWLVGRLWRAFRRKISIPYEFFRIVLPMPQGCFYIPGDVGTGAAAIGDQERVTSIRVRLSPEIFVTFGVSSVPPPVTPVHAEFGKGKFMAVGDCLFAMEVIRPITADSLLLRASGLRAVVESVDHNGVSRFPIQNFEIPCTCRPQRMGLVSWWVGEGPKGFPYVLFHVGYDGDSRPDACSKQQIKKVPLGELDKQVVYNDTPFYKIE